jgi:hypothetical protein
MASVAPYGRTSNGRRQTQQKSKSASNAELGLQMGALPYITSVLFQDRFGARNVATKQLRDFIFSLETMFLSPNQTDAPSSRIRVFTKISGVVMNSREAFEPHSFYVVLHFLKAVISPSLFNDPVLLGDGGQPVLVSRMKFERAARASMLDVVPFRSQPSNLPHMAEKNSASVIGTTSKIEHIKNPFATVPGLVSQVMDDCAVGGQAEIIDLDLALDKMMNLYWGLFSKRSSVKAVAVRRSVKSPQQS